MSDAPDQLSRFGFDTQARGYDARTGLPESVLAAVACTVADRCPGDRSVLEVGAGTGQIGQLLADRLGPRYLGMDASRAMLALFRERAPHALLALGDANAIWPVAEARFGIVFMSRVLHLLDARHVQEQLGRTLGRGGTLLVGRRERQDSGVHDVLRHELQRGLRELGYQPKAGHEAVAWLDARQSDCVAQWTSEVSAAEVLESWRNKRGLCGVDVMEAHKRELLDQLERYARASLGSLQRTHEHTERYMLTSMRPGGERGESSPPGSTGRAPGGAQMI